ncbi:MAG TPA: hypothetical protein VLS49_04790 [Usitatibacter sp.]|nr:hypothetical protein [Usitatibacter sp.]
MRKTALRFLPALLAMAGLHQPALAHGFAGKRFFPATFATDDPFVADELSFPTLSRRNLGPSGEGPGAQETAASVDFAKRITKDFGMEAGATWLRLKSDEGVQRGFDNAALGAKYRFHLDEEHESIASVGVDWDIGNTGAKSVGAETFSTVTPALFAGRGFGDLPDSMRFLRPLAVTGSLGVGIPSRSSTASVDEDGNTSVERHPHTLGIGLALEYSLPYLQSFVKDLGLREPFNRIIPLVELAMEKPLDRGGGSWSGTVNPGLIWAGRYTQLGLEAVIPVNHTGGGTGVLVQLHFFLDDLFPRGVGRPLR